MKERGDAENQSAGAHVANGVKPEIDRIKLATGCKKLMNLIE